MHAYIFFVLLITSYIGTTDIDQLGKIFNVIGTPTTTNWPGVELLPLYMEFEYRQPMNLISLFRHSSSKVSGKESIPLELDLLLRLLTLDPTKRLTATQVYIYNDDDDGAIDLVIVAVL